MARQNAIPCHSPYYQGRRRGPVNRPRLASLQGVPNASSRDLAPFSPPCGALPTPWQLGIVSGHRRGVVVRSDTTRTIPPQPCFSRGPTLWRHYDVYAPGTFDAEHDVGLNETPISVGASARCDALVVNVSIEKQRNGSVIVFPRKLYYFSYFLSLLIINFFRKTTNLLLRREPCVGERFPCLVFFFF